MNIIHFENERYRVQNNSTLKEGQDKNKKTVGTQRMTAFRQREN